MATPMSSTNPERDEGPREFKLFTRLPAELQLIIWRSTLPRAPVIRFLPDHSDPRTILWPFITLPKPPTSDNAPGGAPLIKAPLPPTHEIPAALHVCRASRQLALNYFALLPVQEAVSITGFLFGLSDIVDICSLDLTMRDLLKTHKKHTDEQIDQLQDLALEVNLQNHANLIDIFMVEKERLLYDLGLGRFCVILSLPLLGYEWQTAPQGFSLRDIDSVVVRSSSVEEWIFGSRITIGRVPVRLRRLLKEKPEALYQFIRDRNGIKPRHDTAFPKYPDPVDIMKGYIWILHKIALNYGPASPIFACTRCLDPVDTLRIFVAIMDGSPCPECHSPLIPRIKTRYPGLSLERLDIIFAIPRHKTGYFLDMDSP
ncbi:hypothetical protein F5Y13DRAFT_129247 [Hypoxylon sp. FL1857]|nr:hypothetical protein F5Y13DRAFT_129247 [Hypoxylon sp. FL1857]